jgi:hypothetical protein
MGDGHDQPACRTILTKRLTAAVGVSRSAVFCFIVSKKHGKITLDKSHAADNLPKVQKRY